MGALALADRALGAVLRGACIALVAALFVLILENILRRGFGLSGRPWFDEGIELCFAWLVMLGAAMVWRERGHFRVDLFGPGRAAHLLRIVAAVVALATVATLARYGLMLAERANSTSPVLGAPRALWYACLPAGGGVMTLYALRDLVSALRGEAS